VQMAMSDPKAQRKSLLSDCTWLVDEYGSFNIEALKFLMHFREPGVHFILFFHILIFFSFSHTHFFFFSYTFFSSFSFS
jgi:hypothetical protein